MADDPSHPSPPPEPPKKVFGIWTSRRDAAAGVAFALLGLGLLAGWLIGVNWWDSRTERRVADYEKPCHDALGAPLKAADLEREFAKEGVTVFSLPRSMYCDRAGPNAVATVSNRRSVTSDEDAVDRDGWIFCLVMRGGQPVDFNNEFGFTLDKGPDSPIFNGTKSQFGVGNLGCSLYPGSDKSRQTETMMRVFRRLEVTRAQRAAAHARTP